MAAIFSVLSVYDFIEAKKADAVERAEKVPESDLSNPGVVDQLAQFRFEVAVLLPKERKGKRRTIKRDIRDFGQRREVDADVIDVYIPFRGWAKSFEIKPSSSTMIFLEYRAMDNFLVATFPDDDKLDQAVNSFIETVNSNLQALRNDLASVPQQIRQAVESVVARRKSLIEARAARDKNRSFPIE